MEEQKRCDTQADRFSKILATLKRNGISQKKIADRLDRQEDYISNMKRGKLKEIPDDVLAVLQKEYNINPAYIKGDSEIPFFDIAKPFENFESFVTEWETVEHGKESYLYLTMNGSLYEFLLEVDKTRLSSICDSIDEEASVRKLKELYSGTPVLKKYVVIPCNDFEEIISTSAAERKQLAEVLNIIELGE